MVYVTGDTHGEYKRFEDKRLRKLSEGDVLIVCGDFGFLWDGSSAETKTLAQIGSKKYMTLFIDGCYENFERIEECEETELFGGTADHVYGNLYHLKRGEVYEMEGNKYFAFGGCAGQNREQRINTGRWWEQEIPSMEEMRRGVKNLERCGNTVDYILTHEPPPSLGLLLGAKYSPEPFSCFLEEIFKNINYKHWFFGSLHTDKVAGDFGTAVFTDIVPASRVKNHRTLQKKSD